MRAAKTQWPRWVVPPTRNQCRFRKVSALEGNISMALKSLSVVTVAAFALMTGTAFAQGGGGGGGGGAGGGGGSSGGGSGSASSAAGSVGAPGNNSTGNAGGRPGSPIATPKGPLSQPAPSPNSRNIGATE